MRKVLVITYYWPPAGGPGVQRWLKFVKYLREFGVEPVVYIPENPNYPITDTSLVHEIPEGIKIYQFPIKEPYRWAALLSWKKTKQISSGIITTKNQSLIEKILLWVRGNLFIPDARKGWINPSVKYLSEVVVSEKIDTIITTGPPHSVHLIGLGLQQKHELKWVADFRDPWTSIGYHKKLKLSKFAKEKHKKLERSVLNGADQILVTSTSTKKEFKALTNAPIEIITNGYDLEVTENRGIYLDKKFTISHIGSLLTGRNPSNLWSALSEIAQENEEFNAAFELHLIGVVSSDVLENMQGHGLQPYLRLHGYISHKEAVRLQRQSQVLLVVEINSYETVGIVPGKVFECLPAKRPILAVGPKGWDAGKIITECKAGEVFDYEDKTRLKQTILKWFSAYQNEGLHIGSEQIEKYSRKALTERLAALL